MLSYLYHVQDGWKIIHGGEGGTTGVENGGTCYEVCYSVFTSKLMLLQVNVDGEISGANGGTADVSDSVEVCCSCVCIVN